MKLFNVAFLIFSDTGMAYYGPILQTARNQEEATGIVLKSALMLYPPAQGYLNHSVNAVEVSLDDVGRILDNLKS